MREVPVRYDTRFITDRAAHTESIHFYRKDRQWIAVTHSGHKVSRGEQIDEDIFRYSLFLWIIDSLLYVYVYSFTAIIYCSIVYPSSGPGTTFASVF